MKSFIQFIKPWLLVTIIITGLQLTGQLGNVISFGQSAILKTGLLNAGTEKDDDELFDFNFQAHAIDGSMLQTDSLKGKVIFLNVWATWCGPCRAEMPTIQNLYSSINNPNIKFVMLSVDRQAADSKVSQYINSSGFTFPIYILQGSPTEQLKVPTIPTTFIISKSGKIISVENGMKNYDTDKFRKFLLKEVNR